MSQPSTIDLGVVDADPPAAAPAPLSRRWRRWRQQHRRAALNGTIAALLLAVTTAASAESPPPGMLPHFTVAEIADRPFILHDELLFVSDPFTSAGSLTAYRLADGEVAFAMAELAAPMAMDHAGTPLVLSNDFGIGATSVTAFDVRTGGIRWTEHGHPVGGDDDILVLQRSVRAGLPGELRGALTAIDLASGAARWTVEGALWWSHGFAPQLVTLTADGTLTSYDVRTGAPTATTTGLEHAAEDTFLQAAHDLVLLWEERGDVLTALDAATLQHRWTAEVDMRARYPLVCGESVCVVGRGPVEALNPATGGHRWRTDWLGNQQPRLNAAGDLPVLVIGKWVLDTVTGEPLLELGEWDPRIQADGVPRPHQLFGWLERGPNHGVQRTWLGRLRLDPPAVEVIGSVEGVLSDCQFTSDYAACRVDDQVHVWRLTR